MFNRINKSGELAVSNLGVEDADIRGKGFIGIIAGAADANFSKVWTTGEVVGADDGFGGAGGLIGTFRLTASARNTIMMSWSAANVRGNQQQIGGLVGSTFRTSSLTGKNSVDDSWAAGDLRGKGHLGGFAGNAANLTLNGNWSSGAVSGDGSNVGGFVGTALNADIDFGYWNRDTSDHNDFSGGRRCRGCANFGGGRFRRR